MTINKKGFKALSIILAASLLSPTIVSASPSVTKEETVYINLESDGKEVDKLSSIWIHSDSDLGEVTDESTLKDIVNIKEDIQPSNNGDKLVWTGVESDIYYQGTPEKDLPLKANIKYYLDDKEVNPKDIIGESGKLKIQIDVINTDKKTVKLKNNKTKTLYTPYIVAAVVDLPIDTFSNIEINSGKLMSDGSRQIVSQVFLPGLKESFDIEKDIDILEDNLEITADVENFEMESIMFAATSKFPDIDTLDAAKDLEELKEGLEEMEEASKQLVDATEKLYDGQKELGKGVDQLVDGSNELHKGSNELLNGSNQLKEGINAAHSGSKKINEGANTLSSSANKLGQGFLALGNGTIEFSNKAAEFSQGAAQLADGLDRIPESTQKLGQGMDDIISNTETISNGQSKLTSGLNQSTTAVKDIKAGKETEAQVIASLLKSTEGLDEIVSVLEQDQTPEGQKLAAQMKGIVDGQKVALNGIQGSSKQLISGLSQLETGLEEAKTSSNQLAEGTKKVNEGQKQVKGGLNQLSQGTLALKDASKKLSQGSAGLKEGANTIKNNAETAKSGASQFASGANELANATKELNSGLGELSNGSSQLNQGIVQLNQGTKALLNGGKELQDGSNKLVDGSKELNEGMNKFNDEGIGKIIEELENSDLDIEDLIDTKDELINLSKENDNFSGISKDMEGKLKFIMKTESIEKDEIEEENQLADNTEEVEEVQEDKGFINWIKNIFNKEA